jgi:hypothetical protein
VTFQSIHGHRDDDSGRFAAWRYQPSDPANYIGDQLLPVQINLWLFKGEPPKNHQQVALIVRSFQFIPERAARRPCQVYVWAPGGVASWAGLVRASKRQSLLGFRCGCLT